MPTTFDRIERQLDDLSQDEQLRLIDVVSRRLRSHANGSVPAIGFDLEAMAADPEIQAEIRAIEREFSATEMDGLEDE